VTVSTLFAMATITELEKNGAVTDASRGSKDGSDSRFRFPTTPGGWGTGTGNGVIEQRRDSRSRCAGPDPG
jgi:hypothetical protein